MKTLLVLVGKTVNKHFVAGIKDYHERIEHYMPFDIAVIPELKNTKHLSNEQQKEREGELILEQIKPMDTVVLLDERRGIPFDRVCKLATEEAAYSPPSRLCHRWALWFFTISIQSGQ